MVHWWECFTLNQRFRIRALGMKKILLGVSPPNERARSKFSQSSNMGSGHQVENKKKCDSHVSDFMLIKCMSTQFNKLLDVQFVCFKLFE